MSKKLRKNILALTMSLILVMPLFAVALSAQAADLDPWGGKEDEIKTETGLGERDPREIAAAVINVIMGFLGIVAVIIILIGGFKWMTASGNEDKVAEAKKLIVAGIIGLVIILAAFAITKFVLNQLLGATGAT
ncbi:hypothetical protein COT96_01970 [Candidatus Falkowbacteria bacterium CG10_big_fil_rev_8_21_14_0_10_38_22]|uniref:DUF4134 domain-containing protein n=1 Tax=Candidatus Falkowbacteria bacterium CG10_big_fil_rev_8_21_14_0_10_38_22 TaxID=1974564 RepID=A0A2M6WQP6_9BACT|nr:MAG: hypothetical protein COT96_01970 [Candidatus Falkowbacteria bacterium CG10_big_fil_rev_8_21_14_0_10_38_22]